MMKYVKSQTTNKIRKSKKLNNMIMNLISNPCLLETARLNQEFLSAKRNKNNNQVQIMKNTNKTFKVFLKAS